MVSVLTNTLLIVVVKRLDDRNYVCFILNKAQQGNLASQLSGNGMQGIKVAGKIKGTDIILSVDRTLQLQGKQLLTWG